MQVSDTGMHNGPDIFGLSAGYPWSPNKSDLIYCQRDKVFIKHRSKKLTNDLDLDILPVYLNSF